MKKTKSIINITFAVLLLFCCSQSFAQEPIEPVSADNPPAYIPELLVNTEITQEQIDAMRADGQGWGHIRLAAYLADRIAADSGGSMTFDDAFQAVLDALEAGQDFGEIANDYDLRLGEIIGNGNGVADGTGTNTQPPFITKLIDSTELTQEQVELMRTGGAGWGNIMLATRLAEQIAADSGGTILFADAFNAVLDARADGKGFGEIAADNNLKLGKVVGQANKAINSEQAQNQVQNKNRNIFQKLLGFLGNGKTERIQNTARIEAHERNQQGAKPEKLEKPEKPERPQKLERPEKPEKPERPGRN